MTPTLLQNEKVLKYFGCDAVCTPYHFMNVAPDEHDRCVCARLITAMSEPIKINEKYIALAGGHFDCGVIGVMEGKVTDEYHPFELRLSDQFQPQRPPSVCEHPFKGLTIMSDGPIYCDGCKNYIARDSRVPPPAEKCLECDGPNGGAVCPEHKPSPTPPEPKCDICATNPTLCSRHKPEPRGEFGDDVEREIRVLKRQKHHWVGERRYFEVTEDDLRSLLRLARAVQPEAK